MPPGVNFPVNNELFPYSATIAFMELFYPSYDEIEHSRDESQDGDSDTGSKDEQNDLYQPGGEVIE